MEKTVQDIKSKSISQMSAAEQKEFVRRKMTAFVCKTCDMADSATPAQLDALPKVADILTTYYF